VLCTWLNTQEMLLKGCINRPCANTHFSVQQQLTWVAAHCTVATPTESIRSCALLAFLLLQPDWPLPYPSALSIR
jgi:hypothetical protein